MPKGVHMDWNVLVLRFLRVVDESHFIPMSWLHQRIQSSGDRRFRRDADAFKFQSIFVERAEHMRAVFQY